MTIKTPLALAALLTSAGAAQALPMELITNGGFETGDFSGWTVTDQTGSFGSFFIDDADGLTPDSGFGTVGPAAGAFYAVSDQQGAGAHALTQGFTVPVGATSVLLTFDMFVNDHNGAGALVNPAGLDYTASPNQHARVDILTAGAGALSTAAADVVTNLYLGVDGTPPNPYTAYSFDLSALLAPGTSYQLRFAEVDNQWFFNQGVDNVSLVADTTAVPVPATLALFGLGLTALGRRRRTGSR